LSWANNKLEKVENASIQIQDSLKSIQPRKKSKEFTYESTDRLINDSLHFYTVNVHNKIFDSVIQSIVVRFENHKHLFADFNCLNPNKFCID